MDSGYYLVSGILFDCVYLGLLCILENDFELVVFGINYGVNLGDDVVYLGIVVVVIEGCYMGLLVIVVLLVGKDVKYFEIVVKVVLEIICKL